MFQTKDNSMGSLRYAGRSRAVVVDNDDPLKRGRIRVNSPVLGETNWIPYLTEPGTFNVPAVDSVVYIECDGGYYSHPVAWGNLNYGADDDLQFPEVFQRVSPTNRGLYTPGGLLLEIDDGEDPINFTSRGVRLTTAGETLIDLKDESLDKSFTFEFASGTNFKIDSVADSFVFEANFGDRLEISAANGIQHTTPAAGGTTISQKGGKIDFTSTLDSTYTSTQGNITITAQGTLSLVSQTGDYELTASAGNITLTGSGGAVLKIGGGKVGLGGPAGELVDLVGQLLDEVDKTEDGIMAITVPTAVGPSGPPINSATFVAIKATLATIKTALTGIKGGI